MSTVADIEVGERVKPVPGLHWSKTARFGTVVDVNCEVVIVPLKLMPRQFSGPFLPRNLLTPEG